MNPKIRWLVRLVIILVVGYFALQPYNWYCQISQKCDSISISYYIPRPLGNIPINVDLETTNYREDLQFAPVEPSINTVMNKKNEVFYVAKNLSNKIIRFRPTLEIEPASLEEYVRRYDCLCFREYKLKKGEEITLKMRFSIDEDITTNQDFSNMTEKNIKIRYKVK